MRKLGMSIAALGLAAAGLAVPATAAQAATSTAAANHCNDIWPGRNGKVYAYDSTYCNGYLGSTAGNDSDWDAAGGGFDNAGDKASSVLNAGYTGSYDIVKFYYLANYGGGYNCLDASEFFVDNLSRNTFSNGANMNNNIRSHKWVDTCDRFMH
ncbi:hypothetical protein [Streptomyces sp. NBC_00385]|uniref:hypothetical protein n=1 Tax=Streptomyces sp. NBC_00385 TaxID=2975733 RepID=UPI002DD88484|nr:hypothetical protein [Streptomyces sp. NBC_00385]WRZ05455.1 hypothetical protein OG959_19970 [Streptomyces sp. NBC_00385]